MESMIPSPPEISYLDSSFCYTYKRSNITNTNHCPETRTKIMKLWHTKLLIAKKHKYFIRIILRSTFSLMQWPWWTHFTLIIADGSIFVIHKTITESRKKKVHQYSRYIPVTVFTCFFMFGSVLRGWRLFWIVFAFVI